MNIYEKLAEVQDKLKVSKDNFNAFGKYKYRSCEDILESVKPLLKEVKAIVLLSDEALQIGDRFYIRANATFINIEKEKDSLVVCAYAREDLDKKGMDLAQVTGSVSSYARKYALNGLFCIDDTKDSDATNKYGQGGEDTRNDHSNVAGNQKPEPKPEPEPKPTQTQLIAIGTLAQRKGVDLSLKGVGWTHKANSALWTMTDYCKVEKELEKLEDKK